MYEYPGRWALRRTDRFLIAYGGLILLIGVFALFISIMSFVEFIDLSPILRRFDLLTYTALIVGALDLLCGLLLAVSRGQEEKDLKEVFIVEGEG